MPFGGVLALFTENLKYYSAWNYSSHFCIVGNPLKGSETFLAHEFLDEAEDSNEMFWMILSSKSGCLYLVLFNLRSLEKNSNINFMQISSLGSTLPADTLCQLGDNTLFLGSDIGT